MKLPKMFWEIPFFVIEGKYHEGGESHVGYGICCYFKGTTLRYEDLSRSRKRVEKLVECCNELSISPAHLKYIVKDFFVKELWEISVERNEIALSAELEELRNQYLDEREEDLEELKRLNEKQTRWRR